MSVYRVLLVVCCALLIATTTGWAGSEPVTVSPGSPTGSVIGDTCPTFSWGSVEGAKSYELVVYRVEEGSEEARPVLRQSFAGSVASWTPSLDRCLERGGQYAWSVRGVGNGKESEWSPPSLFQVASGPSEAEFEEAVAVVRQYLKQEDTGRTVSGPSSASGPDIDADGDGVPDCLLIDLCPNDPNKTSPGTCGCGVPDIDADGDGVPDCLLIDLCPNDPNKTSPGTCGCGVPSASASVSSLSRAEKHRISDASTRLSGDIRTATPHCMGRSVADSSRA